MKQMYIFFTITLLASSMVISKDESHANTGNPIVILFTTMNEDYPIGQYWPAQQLQTKQGVIMNPSSVFIEPHDWYSNIIQSNIELADERANYIGFYTDYETDKPIYLYGTKDEIVDANADSDDEDS